MTVWMTQQLGEVAQIFNGKTPSRVEQRSQGHSVLKIRDINEFGKFRGAFDSFVEPSLAEAFASKHLRDGDSLILNAAHNADYVGSKTYFAEPPTFGSLPTGEWLIIRPEATKLHPAFVYRWINLPRTRSAIRGMIKGIHLYPNDVARLRIYLPPFAEQRRIANILDKADALRTSRRAALAQVDTLTQAIFLEMFGDPVLNPKGMRKQPLGELVKLKSGDFLPTSAMVESGAHPVFGGNGVSGYHNEYMFEEPQIVIGRVGVYCGCVHVSPPGSWITDNALYVRERSDDLLFGYLAHALKQAHLNRYASQFGQPLVSGSRIYPVEVLVPPKSLQEQFVVNCAKAATVKAVHEKATAASDTLFASLQQRAFAGEL